MSVQHDRRASAPDIDAREREVLGESQRIAPLELEDLSEEERALILSVRKSLQSPEHSPLPEVFATMIRHPGLFNRQLDMAIQLMSKGALPARERELAVLRVAWLCRAPYEWGEHVGISKRFGITAEEVERITLGPCVPGWSEHEAAILTAVDELLGEQMVSDEVWEVLARHWTERQLIEFPTLVGQFVATAYWQNTLRIRLERGNKGLRQR